MRKFFLASTLWVFALPLAADLDFDFAGHHYRIVTTGAPWATARANAEAALYRDRTGQLCIIKSEAENQAVFNSGVAAGVDTISNDGGGGIYFWLGGTDNSGDLPAASEGEFFWIDGTQFWQGGPPPAAGGTGTVFPGAFERFSAREPDDFGAGQDYAVMSINGWVFGVASDWNDVAGTSFLDYCIEWEFEVLFADGFESGDTVAWTSTQQGRSPDRPTSDSE
ncbi:MAG: hypothetical protein AAF604_06580 [Acidobacteriota bacterium]